MSRLSASRGSMRWLSVVAATARVFFGVAVDLPELYGAGWLAALLGALLLLPSALAADFLSRREHRLPLEALRSRFGQPACAIVCAAGGLCLLLDAACVAVGAAGSAGYIALRDRSFRLLLALPLLAAWIAASSGGEALGGSARIWVRLAPWFAVPVLLIQFSGYRLGYLFPLLGEGVPSLMRGGLRCAGWYAVLLPAWLVSRPGERVRPCRVSLQLAASAIAACVLLLMYSMENPPVQTVLHTRAFQINAVITNGRFPTSLQLPIIALWFIGMAHLLALDLFIPARLLRRCLPAVPAPALTLGCSAAAYILAALGLAERETALALADLIYPGLWLALILLLPAGILRKGGRKP